MTSKTYARTVSDAKVMASGVRKNKPALQRRGITEQMADNIEAMTATIEATNNEQESLKAKLKETTDRLNKQLLELKLLTTETRQVVKLEIPQVLWKEFGITAKR